MAKETKAVVVVVCVPWSSWNVSTPKNVGVDS